MATPYETLDAHVKALAAELPGITFGYIGNVGVDRSGAYDDRSWRIFLPHPGRVGESFRDDVHLGATAQLAAAVDRWADLERAARRLYAAEDRTTYVYQS